MRKFNSFLSILLSAVMFINIFAFLPVEANAADPTTWSELQSAFNNGGTVTLSDDITAGKDDSYLTVASGKTVVLDLNGHILSKNRSTVDEDKGNVLLVSSGAALTVKDSSGDNSGKITGGFSKNGGAIINNGTLNIESGTISVNTASEKGGAIYNKGYITITGGVLEHNVSQDGGAIYNEEGGIIELSGDAEIKANKTTEYGGGGITNLGTLSVSDNVSVVHNYGYSNGGGIWNGGTLTVTGGTIICNSASQAGSGVYNNGILNVQDRPEIHTNMGDDVFLPKDKVITVTGQLDWGASVGVASSTEKVVFTSGYRVNNPHSNPANYFFENGTDSAEVIKSDQEVRFDTDGIPYVERSWIAAASYVTKQIRHCTDYRNFDESTVWIGSNTWYVVKGDVTVEGRMMNSHVANVILCDGASLHLKEGISVTESMESELNIYSQLEGTGKLKADGEYDKASIGPDDELKSGIINIYGGNIEANYGIGSAYKCKGGTVRIYSAKVKSRSIGAGQQSEDDSSVYIGIYNSKINSAINNGAGVLDLYNSTVEGDDWLTFKAAFIGGNEGCTKAGNINIVNCYINVDNKLGEGAVIGGSEDGACSTIRITNSTVNAQNVSDENYGTAKGAGIGGGKNGQGGTIIIENSCVVASAFESAAIGGGSNYRSDSITITNSVVMAAASEGGAGIGGGDESHGGNITIDKSYVYSKTEFDSEDPEFDYSEAAGAIMIELMAKMTNGWDGSGAQCAYYFAGYLLAYWLTVLFTPNHGGAAIGGGDSGDSGTINIIDSTIEAIGGDYTAGIGGGDEGGCNNITIASSTVKATGGIYAAGIGSGDEAEKMETITIISSNVTAKSEKEGAGIGGGNDVSNNKIIITDSTIDATGGKFAAGIGGGDDGSGGTITISGSTVKATGGKDAAGIGGGEGGDGGTIEIYSSNVKATGDNYGAGIGCGESGDSANISIYGTSTVEAIAGDSGYASAIGTGDYTWSSPDLETYIDDGLAVKAGSSSSDATKYNGTDRYDAVWNNKYALIYPCEHEHVEWHYESSTMHRQYCKDCGTAFGEFEPHVWDEHNVCTICGGSAVMVTLNIIEKNTAGEDVQTSIEVTKYTEYALPTCTNVPEGMAFICWEEVTGSGFYDPGDAFTVTGNTVRAVYLPIVTTAYVDVEGNIRTVQARQLSNESMHLSPGWYVADSDLDYSIYADSKLMISGDVRLILKDGVTLHLNDYAVRPIDSKNGHSKLSIFGQLEQSGVIECDIGTINGSIVRQYGGNIISDGTVNAPAEAVFARGTTNIKSINAVKDFSITGGNFETNTILVATDAKLGWTDLTDSIKFTNINVINNKGSFTIVEEQAFTDGENVYSGTLTADEINAIKGKTLTPYLLHHFDEPEWTWSTDYDHATALFRCTDEGCGYEVELEADVSAYALIDKTVHTAKVVFYGETYTDTRNEFPDDIGGRLVGYTLSLDGDIAVNFYMDLSERVLAHKDSAYMHFTIPSGGVTFTQDVLVKDAVAKKLNDYTYYVFKCRVSAKEMTSEIKAQMFDDEKSGEEYTYSIREYADHLFERATHSEEDARAVPLVTAMLHYGAAAQVQFGITTTPANEGIEDTGWEYVTAADINRPYDKTTENLPSGVKFEGATLSLKSETTLSLYFTSSESLTFACEGFTVEKVISGKYQVARIRGIPAAKLKDDFTLIVNNNENYHVTYSPMTYCYDILNDSTGAYDEILRNTVKTLFKYSEAADDYFNKI